MSSWNNIFAGPSQYGSEPVVGVDSGRSARVSASFVGNMVENALYPPNLPNLLSGSGTNLRAPMSLIRGTGMNPGVAGYNNDGDSSEFYQISGIGNSTRAFSAVRQIFGQWRVAPDNAAEQYKLIQGDVEELYTLFDLGYGHVEVSDLKIGNTPVANFRDLSYKVWQNYTDQTPWFYRNDHSTDSYDLEITSSAWITRAAPAAISNSVFLEIHFPDGLGKTREEDSVLLGEAIQFNLEYQKDGGSWRALSTVPGITWSKGVSVSGNTFTISQRRTSAFTLWIRLEFKQNEGQYNIRIKRPWGPNYDKPDPPEPSISQYYDKTVLTAISSVTFRPPCHFPVPHTVIEFRIYATDQIEGMLDQFTCIAKRHIPVWDGANWNLEFSRNPAWVACEILRGDANPRPVPDSRIDLESFKAWADWCDEKAAQGDTKFTVDANMDAMSTVQERLLSVMHSARASLTIRGGKYAVIWEHWPTEATQVFTPHNSWGFTGTRVWTRPVDGLKVEWIDPNLDYQQTELIVYADGKDETNAQFFETISCPYCTRWEQAFRDGRYHLAVGKLRPELFTIVTDIEHLVCERGDMVEVQHDVPRAGGSSSRITEINGADITTREPLLYVPPDRWEMLIRYDDSTTEKIEIIAQVDPYTVTLAQAPTKAKVGDLIVSGKVDTVTQQFLIRSIIPSEQLTAVLTLVPYSPEIKDADTGPIPPYIPPIADDEWYPSCIDVNNVAVDITYTHINRMPVADVLLSWPHTKRAVLYEIWYSEDGIDYTFLSNSRASEYRLWNNKPILNDDYPINDVYVKILPVSAWGTKPAFGDCLGISFTPPVDTEPPGKPLFFSGNISGNIIHLTWLPPSSPDIAGYVLRWTPHINTPVWANGTIERELIPYDSFSVDVNARIGAYMLKTIDTSGNYSSAYSLIRTTIPSLEGMNYIETVVEQPDWTGQKLRVVKSGDTLILDKAGAGPCGAFDYGVYTFDEQHTVDVGSIEECYLSATVSATGDECIFIASWPTMAAIDPIAATGQDDWDVIVQVRTATSLSAVMADWLPNIASVDPIGQVGSPGDWSGWQTLTAGYYTGRYFQFRAILTTIDDRTWPVVHELSIEVDMPDRIESVHDIQVPVGGMRVLFSAPFKNVPAIATTHDNVDNPQDYLKIGNISEDGFDVEVFDQNSTSVTGQIDYVARGYGKILPNMQPAILSGEDDNVSLMPAAVKRPTTSLILR